MTDPTTIRAALEESFDALEALGADLTSAEWEAPSLCPDWTVRDVFQHVVGIENALVSWVPDAANTPPPFRLAGTFANEVADSDSPTFMECVRDVLARRRRDLGVLGPSDLEQPSWTPVGPGTYGRFMEIRVFDFWVHERDITTPLARTTDDTGARAELALAEVERSLGYIVGKKVGLPDGRSIVFHLNGPLAATSPSSWTEGPEWSTRFPWPTSRSGRTRSPSSSWPAAASTPKNRSISGPSIGAAMAKSVNERRGISDSPCEVPSDLPRRPGATATSLRPPEKSRRIALHLVPVVNLDVVWTGGTFPGFEKRLFRRSAECCASPQLSPDRWLYLYEGRILAL